MPVLCLIPTLVLSIWSPPRTDFFVSPQGNDAWVGSRHQPYRTLDRARNAVREERRLVPGLDAPLNVWMLNGTFELDRPFVLTLEDSGTERSPTIYHGSHAVISGGRTIRGWRPDSRGWWTTVLPEVRSGAWSFSQLFVNGHRRYRPRLPKAGYYHVESEVAPTQAAKGHGFDRFGFRPGDIRSDWSNLKDVELLCFHIWDMSRMRIGHVDDAADVVTTAAPTGFDANWAEFVKGNRYIVDNVKEALGEPGEWYLDRVSGELTYIPIKGEAIDAALVVAPKLDRLVDVQGDPGNGRYVQYVRFENCDFEYTNWNLPPKGRFFPQAEVDLGAAISAVGMRNCDFASCKVSHTGEYGMEFGRGCRSDLVRGCIFEDLGAGGVKIGEVNQYDDEGQTAQAITVSRCDIHAGGRLHPAAVGVWIGQSSHDEVTENEIHDFYYTGVSDGWTWGYGKSEAHDNLIEFNEIYDIGQGVLSDMGGIYTLGVQRGTKLVGNRIHDVDSFSYGGWGIYPDEGSSFELIDGNVVFRTKSGGFHQHYGRENLVTNNIFAFAREAEIIRTRAEDHVSFTFEHNIVYWSGAPLLGSTWSGNNYKLDDNLYWRSDGKPIEFAGMTLDQWHAKGQDLHSIIADPRFVNAESGDFRLRLESPAGGVGYRTVRSPSGFNPQLGKRPEPLAPPAFPVGNG